MIQFNSIGMHMGGCIKIIKNDLWVRGQFGYLIEEISKYTKKLYLLLDEYPNTDLDSFEIKTDYKIKSKNVKFISLGKSGGFVEFFNRMLIMKKNLSDINVDFLLIREPSRRSPFISFYCKKIPRVYLFGGDWNTSLNDDKNIKMKFKAYFFTKMLRTHLKNSLVYVNNKDLLNRWENHSDNISILKTTTIKNEQIYDNPVDRFHNRKKVSVLFVGRLDPLKGIETLLIAISKINSIENKKWELNILGSGEEYYAKYLQDIVFDLKISDHVTFNSYVDFEKIFEFYKKADVVVLPTLAENVSRVIWEAMAMSCPVITTAVGGHKSTFIDYEDVIFFRPGDSDDLAEKLLQLSKNKSEWLTLTTNGIKTVRKNTIEIMTRNIIDGVQKWMNNK